MNAKEGNFISAVIRLPHRESATEAFLEMVSDTLSDHFKKYELICVNDDAASEVVQAVHQFKQEHPEVTISIVNMGIRQGLEASMNAGIDLSIGDYVYEFDSCYADYNKDLIIDVYNKAQEGFDIVSAAPPVSKSKVTSRLFYKIFNAFSQSPYKLRSERFRIISRRAINRVSAYSKAVYASAGLRIAEVNYEPRMEKTGHLLEESDRGGMAINALVIFTNVAYKVSLAFTCLMALFMVVAALYTVIVYVGHNKPVEGWAPIMGLMSLGFFAVFAVLSVIIKYADVILNLVFMRQRYLVASVEKL